MLYGKWRPRGFDEVVGQDHIVTTLKNALASGQVAHAYLFSGPRGTGKTTTARILARALNCASLKDGEPCNRCPACTAILAGAALDLIEMDAASNRGIDDIRELRDRIAFAPADLKVKVYLLDEVHMLTTGAFNALLKTLEEPPPHAVFILATTEAHEVPATVLSRCQRYEFRRVPNQAIVQRLRFIASQEGMNLPEEGLLQIAIQSRGGMRDAITMLEQVAARYGTSPSTDEVIDALGLVHDARSESLARALVERDLAGALDIARDVAGDGVNVSRFARETVDILRDVLRQALRGQADPTSRWAAIAAAAIAAPGGPSAVARAIEDLAAADFRLDPMSPIPLEVACASAVLGRQAPATAPAAIAEERPPAQREGPRPRPAAPARPAATAAPAEATPEERFLKELYESCRMVSSRGGGWLNGSCRVLTMEGEVLELGFWNRMHMEKVGGEFRQLVEQQAEALLQRRVELKVTLIEESQAPALRPARRGHLAEAARQLGAVPVQKDT